MLVAQKSEFRRRSRIGAISLGVLALVGALSGCGDEEPEEVQYVYPRTTAAPEPGIWTTGLTTELYNRIGEVSAQTNFAKMGEVGVKTILLDRVTYQVISNCGEVTRHLETWDSLIKDTQDNTSLDDGDVVIFYNFVRDEVCPNVDPTKLD
ncbi:hypothetical protein B2J88_01705 [Rhodococcus sp. SRB_17]|nr:hypothetical protein [Rhodococcus sp. SRB_17]